MVIFSLLQIFNLDGINAGINKIQLIKLTIAIIRITIIASYRKNSVIFVKKKIVPQTSI